MPHFESNPDCSRQQVKIMVTKEKNDLLIELFTEAKAIPDAEIPTNLVLALLPIFERHKEDDVYPLLVPYSQLTAIIETIWHTFKYAKKYEKMPGLLNKEKEYTALYEMLVNCALSIEAMHYEEKKR